MRILAAELGVRSAHTLAFFWRRGGRKHFTENSLVNNGVEADADAIRALVDGLGACPSLQTLTCDDWPAREPAGLVAVL